MALESEEVRLAPSGHIYVAPTGTALPTTLASLSGSYVELGYVTEDGVTMTPSVEFNDIRMWQSINPVKKALESGNFTMEFAMGQVNQQTMSLYFFGGEWVLSGGIGRLDFSSTPAIDERVFILDWEDDEGDTNRLVLPRAVVTEREGVQLTRSDATVLGITLEALDDNGLYGYLLSDNPNLVPLS